MGEPWATKSARDGKREAERDPLRPLGREREVMEEGSLRSRPTMPLAPAPLG